VIHICSMRTYHGNYLGIQIICMYYILKLLDYILQPLSLLNIPHDVTGWAFTYGHFLLIILWIGKNITPSLHSPPYHGLDLILLHSTWILVLSGLVFHNIFFPQGGWRFCSNTKFRLAWKDAGASIFGSREETDTFIC